jgi:nitroreductase
MDALECVLTKLDIREFESKDVPNGIKRDIMEAARSTGTGLNTQHWKFIMIEDTETLRKLAFDSTSGRWVENANFAVIILTDPKYAFHLIDAGRVLQNMQLAAWSYGVGSGLFTGIVTERLRIDFGIPNELIPSAIVGFGYPMKQLKGNRKNRVSLGELVYYEKYGSSNIR